MSNMNQPTNSDIFDRGISFGDPIIEVAITSFKPWATVGHTVGTPQVRNIELCQLSDAYEVLGNTCYFDLQTKKFYIVSE